MQRRLRQEISGLPVEDRERPLGGEEIAGGLGRCREGRLCTVSTATPIQFSEYEAQHLKVPGIESHVT